ncbi:uncharacterized protein LOC128891939 isoform X1 [Hylaeus anthracinus]|uniref:uncharacterized protein LOC128891939 isoform X1 n=1 Tax=Hylaeus anthracinus TaxID=313031 RepID=UPI0023B890FF|nr:uncharacterized protein LOC128891939 isoform X1 [Hylaeus anthracinus]
MTVTAFASQAVLIPREIMYFGRNISRLYHRHQKLCRVNSILLGKCLSPPFALDTWTVQRTCHGNKSKVDNFPGTLSKQQAKELTAKLTSEEREHFLSALQECKSEEDKAGYQRQLAAFRWCNELGRPTKIPSLGDVDATGKYCRVPDDWLLRKYVENVPGPTTKNLVLVAIANAIPFIGFGFLDNFIMIIAGDQIEMILNKKFPISTMAAAALGNTVSDIIGIGSVHYVEIFAHKIGFQAPKLTSIELNLPKTKLAANLGRVVGVTIGCLIGMTPIPLFSYLHNGG